MLQFNNIQWLHAFLCCPVRLVARASPPPNFCSAAIWIGSSRDETAAGMFFTSVRAALAQLPALQATTCQCARSCVTISLNSMHWEP